MIRTNTTANDRRKRDTKLQAEVCPRCDLPLYDFESPQRWEDEGGALLPPKKDTSR